MFTKKPSRRDTAHKLSYNDCYFNGGLSRSVRSRRCTPVALTVACRGCQFRTTARVCRRSDMNATPGILLKAPSLRPSLRGNSPSCAYEFLSPAHASSFAARFASTTPGSYRLRDAPLLCSCSDYGPCCMPSAERFPNSGGFMGRTRAKGPLRHEACVTRLFLDLRLHRIHFPSPPVQQNVPENKPRSIS